MKKELDVVGKGLDELECDVYKLNDEFQGHKKEVLGKLSKGAEKMLIIEAKKNPPPAKALREKTSGGRRQRSRQEKA